MKILLLLFFCLPALAHKPSDSLLRLETTKTGLSGQWDIAIQDLEWELDLDRNQDGKITWGELKENRSAIEGLAGRNLTITGCALGFDDFLVDEHGDGAYVVLGFHADCGRMPHSVHLKYSLFTERDAQHQGLVKLAHAGDTYTAILGRATPEKNFVLSRPDFFTELLEFLKLGTHHIWIGYDHLLFLVTLLLPAALRRRNGHWVPVESLSEAGWRVAGIVTSFTLAHSITLALAALDVVRLPSRFVESAIALSIIASALNNVWPLVDKRAWLIAFGFGLIHGFGFANVLQELGLADARLAASLLGFNLGVELGQLAVVAVCLPLIFPARRVVWYRRGGIQSGSLVAAAVAAYWFVERAFF